MQEHDFIKIINDTLSDNSYLGDDCAFLSELGLFVTHDTMVEDVHFSLKYATPYQIGYKAVVTNLSDLASALAKPAYITVSLSLPAGISDEFVKKLYEGIDAACCEYNVRVIGGDITGSEKIVVSVCAMGKKQSEYSAKRCNAKIGDYVVVTGTHGASSAGLICFKNKIDNEYLKNKHLIPQARFDAAEEVVKYLESDIACMDSSDGLFDALNQIAQVSNVTLCVDFSKIPCDKETEAFDDFQNLVLFGGEDYELIFTMDKTLFEKLDKHKFFKIGEVLEKSSMNVLIKNTNSEIKPLLLFDHFEAR